MLEDTNLVIVVALLVVDSPVVGSPEVGMVPYLEVGMVRMV